MADREIKLRITLEGGDEANATITLTEENIRALTGEVRKAGQEGHDMGDKWVQSFTRARNTVQGLREVKSLLNATFGDAVALYRQQEQAEAQLEQAMRSRGDFSREDFEALKEYAAERQRVTTFGDEATIQVMAQVRAMGLNTEQTKEAARQAQNLAAITGVDLQRAGRMMTDLLQGNADALGRYNISVDETVVAGGDLSAIMQELERSIGGQAEAMGQTASGQLQQFQNALGDLKEDIGRFVLDASSPFIRTFGDLLDLVGKAPPAVRGLVGTIVMLTGVMVTLRATGIIPATVSMAGLTTATRGAYASFVQAGGGAAGLTAALRAMGVAANTALGPIGWVVLGLTTLAGAYGLVAGSTRSAADAQAEYNLRLAAMPIEEKLQEISRLRREIAELQQQLHNLPEVQVPRATGGTGLGAIQAKEWAEALAHHARLAREIEESEKQLSAAIRAEWSDRVSSARQSASAITGVVEEARQRMGGIAEEIRSIRPDPGAAMSPELQARLRVLQAELHEVAKAFGAATRARDQHTSRGAQDALSRYQDERIRLIRDGRRREMAELERWREAELIEIGNNEQAKSELEEIYRERRAQIHDKHNAEDRRRSEQHAADQRRIERQVQDFRLEAMGEGASKEMAQLERKYQDLLASTRHNEELKTQVIEAYELQRAAIRRREFDRMTAELKSMMQAMPPIPAPALDHIEETIAILAGMDPAATVRQMAQGTLREVDTMISAINNAFEQAGPEGRAALAPLRDALQELRGAMTRTAEHSLDMGPVLSRAMSDAATSLAEGIGALLAGAVSVDQVGAELLQRMGALAVQIGRMMVAFGIAGQALRVSMMNPLTAIAAGAALIALGSAVRAAIQRRIDAATSAEGGTQQGGTPPRRMKRGGRVPGEGTGDKVPALLEPDEFVVRRDVAREIMPWLEAINRQGASTLATAAPNIAGPAPDIPGIRARAADDAVQVRVTGEITGDGRSLKATLREVDRVHRRAGQ